MGAASEGIQWTILWTLECESAASLFIQFPFPRGRERKSNRSRESGHVRAPAEGRDGEQVQELDRQRRPRPSIIEFLYSFPPPPLTPSPCAFAPVSTSSWATIPQCFRSPCRSLRRPGGILSLANFSLVSLGHVSRFKLPSDSSFDISEQRQRHRTSFVLLRPYQVPRRRRDTRFRRHFSQPARCGQSDSGGKSRPPISQVRGSGKKIQTRR